ncbi:MAG: RHS repeat-associated core domain-containing protein [Leptospirales bacterium]
MSTHNKYFVTEKLQTPDGWDVPGTDVAINNVYLNGVRIASMDSNGKAAYYLANHVDSVKVVTDDAGKALSRTEYLPYGETFQQEGDIKFTAKYNGQALDEESDLYYYNARHYDPEIGRFVTADTVIDGPMTIKGWNLYMYVGGNPIMYKDPTGHAGVGQIMENSALTSGEKIVMGGGKEDLKITAEQSKEIENELGGAYKTDGANLKRAQREKNYREIVETPPKPKITTNSDTIGWQLANFILGKFWTDIPGHAPDDPGNPGAIAMQPLYELEADVSGATDIKGMLTGTDFNGEEYTTGDTVLAVGTLGFGRRYKAGDKLINNFVKRLDNVYELRMSARWGKQFNYRQGGNMTAIEHIMHRHGSNTGFANVSKFSSGTNATTIKGLVNEAMRYGSPVPQRGGSHMLLYNFGRTIGKGRDGNATSTMQIFLNDGWVKTAYPY